MNLITARLSTGTIGELLVQIRLLQYGVQAAPPIKDSGNDLIAVNGDQFRAVSVRTSTVKNGQYNKPEPDRLYHVLAVVQLAVTPETVALDASRIFLIPQHEVANAPTTCGNLGAYLMTRDLVEHLFGPLPG